MQPRDAHVLLDRRVRPEQLARALHLADDGPSDVPAETIATGPSASGTPRAATRCAPRTSSSTPSPARAARPGGLVGAGDDHRLGPALDEPGDDRGDLIGRLPLGEHGLRHALPEPALGVEPREAQVPAAGCRHAPRLVEAAPCPRPDPSTRSGRFRECDRVSRGRTAAWAVLRGGRRCGSRGRGPSPSPSPAAAGRTSSKASSSSPEAWRQFEGTTLNFISENTAPTSAIAANLKPFEDLTGIRIKITQLELAALVQKVALDFASGQGAYQIVYADPYQILAPYHEALVDLNTMMDDDSLPKLDDLGDFIPTQLDAAGRFVDKDKVLALPYDAPTMIWQYRKDLFEKHGDQMKQDLGFDPAPSDDSTWEQFYKTSKWFKENAQDDVPYGHGHQAKQHDSLMNDFSNLLWAYGGDYSSLHIDARNPKLLGGLLRNPLVNQLGERRFPVTNLP